MSLRQLISVARRGGWQAARATAPRSVFVVTRWTPRLVRPVAPVLTRSFGGQSFLDEKEVADRVLSVVKNFEKVEGSKVTSTARFKEDLSLDSLDVVEVVMAIEEEFALEIPDAEADKIMSIDDAIKYIASHPQAK